MHFHRIGLRGTVTVAAIATVAALTGSPLAAGAAGPSSQGSPSNVSIARTSAAHGSSSPSARGHTVSADGPSGMDLTDAWNLTRGDPSVLIAYVEGGINWHLSNSKTLEPNIYVNWHELPVPCSGTGVAGATMVVAGVTLPCALTYSPNEADYDVDGNGVVNALDWANDPRVTDANGNGYIDPEDLIAAFSNNRNNDGSAYPNDISGWDFYDNQNDPATVDTAYGHANGMMSTLQGQCPKCMILPVKAGEEALDSTDRLAQAWLFAAEQGARVIVSVTADIGYSSFMAQTVAYLQSKGIVVVESSNDFDSPDHQGGMFWPWVIPGNGVVASSDKSSWVRSDLTSWGTKAMFSVPTGGGSTSESTPTTGGVIGLLLSYGDLAASEGLIPAPLDGAQALQVLRATATAVTDPKLPWPGGPGEWNPQYGYGIPQLYNAMLAVKAGGFPPAPFISSPAWYAPIDPTTTSSLPVTGSVDVATGSKFTWQVQYGLGGNPSTWTTFGTGSGTGSFSGTFGTLDLSSIPQSFWSAGFHLSTTKEVETVDQYTVSFRVVVTDAGGQVGEDRRAVAVHHDPTLLPGFPLVIGSSGESQPALVDLRGTGKLDIVFATSDGSVDALDPATGQELPGWPAHTNALSVLGSYPGVSPGDEPVVAPVAVGDLFHTGRLDVVVTSVDGHVYVFDASGSLLPGWPQTLDTGVTHPAIPRPSLPYTRLPIQGASANPVLAHLSGNQQLQIVQAGMDGYIHAFNPDGSPVSGWPVQVAVPAGFTPAAGYFLLDDQTLPTSPTVADLQQPGVADIVERSQYTEITSGGVTLGAKAMVFAFQPNGQPVPGWPSILDGLAEYYGSAMGPITEGTDAPVSGPITTAATPQGATDQVVVNPVFTPAYALGSRGQVLFNYAPGGSSDAPFTSTGALGDFGGQLTFAQSTVDETTMVGALLTPNTGDPITKHESAYPAADGSSYASGFPTEMQGLDFLGGPVIADVSGKGEPSIIEGGDSSAIQAYQPDGSQAVGFPKFTSGWVIGAPSTGDLLSDGTTDMVATTREGYLFAWSTSGIESGNDQWWRWRHDEWNSASYGTDARPPGLARDVQWSPGSTTLTFEAPGDDWYSGTVARYAIALAPSGSVLPVAPSGAAGTTQTVAIPSGTTGITIQAVDHAGNLGEPVTVGATPPSPPITGYATVDSGGQISSFGSSCVPSRGLAPGTRLNASIVSMASTPDCAGAWLLGGDGGVFSFGNASFHGSTGGMTLNRPVVAMASTPDGAGYWLVASDGGVFCFGDAQFFGSTGGFPLNQPIVGMAATADGRGYWLVASDGGIFAFGDAPFSGSAGETGPSSASGQTVVGMSATSDGGGYWLVASNGNVFAYGDAVYFGSSAQTGAPPNPAVAVVGTADALGYWVITAGGGVYSYGDATYQGAPSPPAGSSIVGASR